MLGTYFVVGLLGLLAVGLVLWVVAGEVGERRKARAAARLVASRRDTRGAPPRPES